MPRDASIPEFSQIVEYVTISGIHPVPFEVHDLSSEQALSALSDEYQDIAVLGREYVFDDAEQATVKTAITGEAWHSDVAEYAVGDSPQATVEALLYAVTRPPWVVGTPVATGDVVQYQKNLYEAVQGHTPEAAWTPDVARALWKRFYEPADDPWPWVQPLAAFDSYPVGAKVTHGGKTWVNELAANVWQPGVTGWKEVTTGGGIGEWKQPTGAHDSYKKGDHVTWKGSTWESTLDANVWEPGVYGWQKV